MRVLVFATSGRVSIVEYGNVDQFRFAENHIAHVATVSTVKQFEDVDLVQQGIVSIGMEVEPKFHREFFERFTSHLFAFFRDDDRGNQLSSSMPKRMFFISRFARDLCTKNDDDGSQ